MQSVATTPATAALLQNVTVVLTRPKHPGNVGFTARCIKNMGITNLVVVPNGTPFAQEEMLGQATPFAKDIVLGIKYCPSLAEALAPMHFVVGTTARKGEGRGPQVQPREAAQAVINNAQNNRVALLFGSEDKGLANDDLRFCHLIVNIPTSAAFSSINLSHAVMILCYEIFVAADAGGRGFVPQTASVQETERMFEQMRTFLQQIDFLKKENPEYWLRHIRKFFARTKLLSKDVKIVRGIMRQIEWTIKNNK
ncbi:MAG: RNA methyltransferase [Deltaproteobacteria bacterium]|nr:RNA methyltransferase [Deltaproteobacteria bacterium]